MNKIWILSTVLLLTACQQQGKPGDSPEARDTTVIAASQNSDMTATGRPTDSTTQPSTFQTMGKVVAARYADVKFETTLPVVRVMVRNGDRVRQGQLLAEQEAYKHTNAVEQHQREIEQARLQMQEVIISQGYDPEQMDHVPQRVRHIAEVKSGLLIAQNKLAASSQRVEDYPRDSTLRRYRGKCHSSCRSVGSDGGCRVPHHLAAANGCGVQGDGV